ncbi:hypothetical protein H4Q26_002764 [Puccinia striiformis f. sp. tritici PST-130]|nr:hypothetical protein H4Q26_002764 [Puccinia striiformis f. sp. tritici PST-130]
MLTRNIGRLQSAGLMNKQAPRHLNQIVARPNRLHQQQTKSIHVENSVGNTLPFKFRGPETSKVGVAMKVASFFFVGFFTHLPLHAINEKVGCLALSSFNLLATFIGVVAICSHSTSHHSSRNSHKFHTHQQKLLKTVIPLEAPASGLVCLFRPLIPKQRHYRMQPGQLFDLVTCNQPLQCHHCFQVEYLQFID